MRAVAYPGFCIGVGHPTSIQTGSDLLLSLKSVINIGTRAFAVGEPILWNVLPSCVKSV